MNPFYFGTDDRRLFGIYEAPRRSSRRRAVLLCHPWGAEYIHAYRAMRQLAKMLSADGNHVLRFDYYGTGDSAGDMTETDLDGWQADIRTAIEELCDTAETSKVSLVGLRLGGALAAQAAVAPGLSPESLVLWDPVALGTQYLHELHRAASAGWWRRRRPIARPTEHGGGHEIMGFPLTERMAASVTGITLNDLANDFPERTLLISSRLEPWHGDLEHVLAQRPIGGPVVERIDSPPAWVEWPIGHPLAGTVPSKVLQRIVEWIR